MSDRLQTGLAFLISMVFFVLSLLVFPYYYGGDQQFYRDFYNGVQGRPLLDAFGYYRGALSSSEPVYFFIVYTFAGLIQKDVLFSAINALLVFLLVKRLLVERVRPIVLLLLSSNFYLFVLLFSAERLKVSLVLFLVATFLSGAKRYGLLVASIFAHYQTIALCMAINVGRVVKGVKLLRSDGVGAHSAVIGFSLAGLLILGGLTGSHIIGKVLYYYEIWGGVRGIVKPAIFAALAVWYAKDKNEAMLASGLVVGLSFLIGSERLTIFAYFIFMYYALQVNRGGNVAVVATSIYFAVKGGIFMGRIFRFGDGFGAGW